MLFIYLCVELKEHCEILMLKRFGKLVDLEALQTMSGSRRLEEMKYERQVQEAQNRQELKMWQVHKHTRMCVQILE